MSLYDICGWQEKYLGPNFPVLELCLYRWLHRIKHPPWSSSTGIKSHGLQQMYWGAQGSLGPVCGWFWSYNRISGNWELLDPELRFDSLINFRWKNSSRPLVSYPCHTSSWGYFRHSASGMNQVLPSLLLELCTVCMSGEDLLVQLIGSGILSAWA